MQLPQEFCERMKPLLGNSWEAFLNAYERPFRRGLRVNTAKITIDEFRTQFPHPLAPSPFAEDCYYLDAPHKAGGDPLHHAGGYYMQEPSAASAVAVLAPQPNEKILDLCAAPGGKSTQIAAKLGDSGLLWSNEYVASRARILSQNLERCGVRRQVVSNNDTAVLCRRLTDYFDAVLVDAPCSGEGMFRKEPQALEEWSLDNIHLCAARQREILHNASLAVRPGGRLVYSTCTFAPEENEAIIAAFLNEHSDFTLETIEVPWGMSAFSFETIKKFTSLSSCAADLTRCRRIFPHHGGEGHFIAKMCRADGRAESPLSYQPSTRDTNRRTAEELYRECFLKDPIGDFVTFNNFVHLLPPELPDLTGINVIHAGITFAEVCKNRLEPCHGAFLATSLADCRRRIDLPLDDARLCAYLRGEEIACDNEKGWTAVGVAGMTVGFGKCSGSKLKNRYPKGLRLL
ncbi:MAG: RsmF rRNA methyltransferase first C-terminal domain-containing protein [Clostridia bacterium]|nr:RsmF rRNA methyltransferase first C-terminal domain-containing protein [Clostridia bacterium]